LFAVAKKCGLCLLLQAKTPIIVLYGRIILKCYERSRVWGVVMAYGVE
jgi:hypothetical protein